MAHSCIVIIGIDSSLEKGILEKRKLVIDALRFVM